MKGETNPKIVEIIMHVREVTAVKGCYEHGTEPVGFTECREFLGCVRRFWLVVNYCIAWSQPESRHP